MRILIVSPKPESYHTQDLELSRIMRESYKSWIMLVHESGGLLECFIEDALSCELLKELGITPNRYLTAIDDRDLSFIKGNTDVCSNLTRIVPLYESAKFINISTRDRLKPPLLVQIRDKEVYRVARAEYIQDACKLATMRFMKDCPAVLMFRAGGNQDTYSSISKCAKDGDGKLLMEVEVKTGASMVFYGGVFLDKEMVKTIVGLRG